MTCLLRFNVRFVTFYNRMLKCKNSIVYFIAKLAHVNYNGSLNCNIMYIKWKYNVNMLKQNMYECDHVIRRCAMPPPNYVPHINLLKELILVRDCSKSIDGFNYNEICEMIDDVSTSFI